MTTPSKYEQDAWDAAQKIRSRPLTRAVQATGDATLRGAHAVGRQVSALVDAHPKFHAATSALSRAGRRAGDALPDVATTAAGGWAREALAATGQTLSSASRIGLSPDRVVKKHQRRGHDVESLADLRKLDLSLIDKVKSRAVRVSYPVAGAASGAGTALVITGSELAIPATAGASAAPSAALIVGAMAADAGVVLGLASRAVGQYALAYGYDPEEPDEKIFILSVINAGTALSTGAKYKAFAELSKLTQGLFRGVTWKVLDQSIVSQVYKQFGARFGVRVTKQSLGRVVPVVGIGMGVVFNWTMLEAVTDAADLAYRRRFLLAKYPHLDGSTGGLTSDEDAGGDDNDVAISVLDELAKAGGPDLRSGGSDQHAALAHVVNEPTDDLPPTDSSDVP